MAATITVKLRDEKDHVLSAWTIGDLIDFGDWVISERLRVFNSHAAQLRMESESRGAACAAIVAASPNLPREMARLPGRVWMLWRSARKADPTLALEVFRGLLPVDVKAINDWFDQVDILSFGGAEQDRPLERTGPPTG